MTLPKMRVIDGERLAAQPVSLEHVRDIEYFDGPLLSLFQDRDGQPWIYYWCDCDEQHNRWLMFRSTLTEVVAYMKRDKSLLDLIRSGGEHYAIDCRSYEPEHVLRIKLDASWPDDYLPEPDAFYEEALRPKSSP